ncbi:hypothetical protein Y032_0096g2913 [Ancylostoma ceylanicum]|uniref:Uncharacterized protein n=1 Tax=Ancylostoma ceylanicum TaxID=53326 RepID=A0A016TJD2_9BILA|nr:hypothetical protein Y032_0096g2913 [Ancylostoma ceylanicum]
METGKTSKSVAVLSPKYTFPLRLYLRTVIVFASKVHAVAMEILVNLIYRWKIRSGDTEKKEFWPGEKHEGLFFS